MKSRYFLHFQAILQSLENKSRKRKFLKLFAKLRMNKILWERRVFATPVKQVQRRLNPPMMEVVKKEIQKLLDAGFHQIPVATEDQEKTTFTCPFWLRVADFVVMCLGLLILPSLYQGGLFKDNSKVPTCKKRSETMVDKMDPSFTIVHMEHSRQEKVDYVSKWVEAKATKSDDAKVVADFVKVNIFSRFGTPRAIISDRGTHFCNRLMEALLKK
ncbi:reverse transcriptase domain-containing protein [Tanacetum coccineum]